MARKRKSKVSQPANNPIITTAGGMQLDRRYSDRGMNAAWGVDIRDPGLPPSEVKAAATLNPAIVVQQLRKFDPLDFTAGPIKMEPLGPRFIDG